MGVSATIENGTGFIQDRAAVVPEGVEIIGDSAFRNEDIASVRFPDTLRTIGKMAFRGSSLESVAIPDSVREIGDNCFCDCERLRSVKLSGSLKRIEGGALGAMGTFCRTGIREIVIPPSITQICRWAFGGCLELASAIIQGESVSIEDSAFYGCKRLTEVDLVQARQLDMGKGAFSECPNNLAIKVPHIPLSNFEKEHKRGAAIGFAECVAEGLDVDGEIARGYARYIKSQRKRLFDAAPDHHGLVQYMMAENMLSESDVEALDRIAHDSKDEELLRIVGGTNAECEESKGDQFTVGKRDNHPKAGSPASWTWATDELREALESVTREGKTFDGIIDDYALEAFLDNGIVRIPEGVIGIALSEKSNNWNKPMSFSADGIALPDSLEGIHRDPFSHIGFTRRFVIELPKNVHVLEEPFRNLSELRVWESQLPFANPHSALCGGGDADGGYELTVLSDESGEVLYRMWVPASGPTYKQYETLFLCREAWLDEANLHSSMDKLFGRLKQSAKIRVAADRLRWPISLSYANEKRYRDYLRKYAHAAVEEFSETDDIEALSYLTDEGIIDGSLLEPIQGITAPAKTDLDSAQGMSAPIGKVSKSHHQSTSAKASKAKLTPAQAADAACALFEAGDRAGVDALRPVAAKLSPVACVRALEAASAFCDVDTVGDLYDLLAPFEFTSNALCLAVMAGKSENAKYLVMHGADFEGKAPWKGPNPRVKGDTIAKQIRRKVEYLSFTLSSYHARNDCSMAKVLDKFDISGIHYLTLFICGGLATSKRMPANLPFTKEGKALEAISPETVVGVLKELTNDGLLDNQQLSSMALAAAWMERYREAEELRELIGPRAQLANIMVRRGSSQKSWKIAEPLDLLVPHCDASAVDYVAKAVGDEAMKAWAEKNWSTKYYEYDPEVIKSFLPYLGPSVSNANRIPLISAARGWLTELKESLSWEGVESSQLLNECLEAAQEHGSAEIVAWLLERIDESKEGQATESDIAGPFVDAKVAKGFAKRVRHLYREGSLDAASLDEAHMLLGGEKSLGFVEDDCYFVKVDVVGGPITVRFDVVDGMREICGLLESGSELMSFTAMCGESEINLYKKDDYRASAEETADLLEKIFQLVASLTNENVLPVFLGELPRKANGGVKAGQIIYEIAADVVYDNGYYPLLLVKTAARNTVAISFKERCAENRYYGVLKMTSFPRVSELLPKYLRSSNDYDCDDELMKL